MEKGGRALLESAQRTYFPVDCGPVVGVSKAAKARLWAADGAA